MRPAVRAAVALDGARNQFCSPAHLRPCSINTDPTTMTIFKHRRTLRVALAACAALLAGACAPSAAPSAGPGPAAQADSPATALSPAQWSAQSSAAEIATWARQGCRRAPGGKDACIERTLVGLIDQAGIAKSMEVLDTLVVVDGDVRLNAHALAHGLGISAYRTPETLARTFAGCPPSQMSGCYHGVIQGYFLSLASQGKEVGAAELDGLCEPHRSSMFLYFQCAHGMGHGLMAVHQNHLPMALEACDLASEDFIEKSCYGGVFMENIVNVTHPHHTAAGHAGTQGDAHGAHGAGGQQAAADPHAAHGQQASADAHAGHGQAAAADTSHGAHDAHAAHGQVAAADTSHGHDAHAAHGQQVASQDAHAAHGAAAGQTAMQHGEWKALDRNDWLYPCNAVAEKYQDACYTMQTSAILAFNYGDVDATARTCDRAPEAMRATCFLSLGRDVTALASQDHRRSIELCGRARGTGGGRGVLWCTLGVVQNLVNLAADPQEGIRFCRAVQGSDVKSECYRIVGESIAALVNGTAQRGESCQAAESEFVTACRRGAGIEPAGTGSDD